MKHIFLLVVLFFSVSNIYSQSKPQSPQLWDADTLGNIRAVVKVERPENIAFAKIDWRRRDKMPERKNIIVTDADGNRIANVLRGSISQTAGEIYFEPTRGPGTYYIYYLPYQKAGSNNYPKDFYPSFQANVDERWVTANPLPNSPNSTVIKIQTINEFNSFSPMEVIAAPAEVKALIDQNRGKAFLVFPEDRMFSIRMTDDIPQRWAERGLTNTFEGNSRRGEFYAFQFGIFALRDLQNVRIDFTDLKSASGMSIPKSDLGCINTDGIDYRGVNFQKRVDVQTQRVQAMWCGADIKQDTAPGKYVGIASVSASGLAPQKIAVTINVLNDQAINGGFNEPEKMTRLKWLNSRMAQENSVIAPYTPITIDGNNLGVLGRRISIGADGLPSAISTFFTPEMTSIGKTPKEILNGAMRFLTIDANGEAIGNAPKSFTFIEKSPGTVSWEANTVSPSFDTKIVGQLEFDGFVTYQIKLTATRDMDLSDIRLELPLNPDSSKYIMGLGEKGARRPDKLNWKWDVATKNQDGAWLGDVNAGIQFSLRDENYVRPLNTNFYLQKPLLLPKSWGNGGKGGISIAEKNGEVLVNNYSGARSLKKGDSLYFNFNLLITPFHALDTDWQWANRFYHRYTPPAEIKATGASVVNIHHANEINPFINYPFIAHKGMKAYVDEAHKLGLKVKIYNTVRELSNHSYETFALRSLGHEIYSPGAGGGFSWLQEHVGDDYIAAWFVPELKDAAIVNSGMSRWHNYYVEGMNWLVDNVGIDGIYLDDVAFDRVTMKRIKRVLTKNGHPGVIDLHSANQFNKNDGFNNSAMLYMEHFPYLNKLWFGEYFDYENNSPDFYLTEVSGIPFGLMGEMLQDGGNPWRGMIYGMTNRMPWSEDADPRPIWKLWDNFGIAGSEMFGYWSPNVPVKTSDPKVLATVYKKNGTSLISIASWAEGDKRVKLNIDWKSLGIDPAQAKLVAPEVAHFQTAREFGIDDEIPVEKNKGWLIIVK